MPFTSNPKLEYLDLPFKWEGTPTTGKGRFVNTEFPSVISLRAVWKWQTLINPQKQEKKNDQWKLEVDFESHFLDSKEDCIVWLGHASFFVRLSGISILIDPVLLDSAFIKRLSPLPVSPDLFLNLDYVLISHDHRDHCDEKSIKLLAKNNPDATWLTGLNMEQLLFKFTKSRKIQEAGWYQKYQVTEPLKISFVPSRHWSKRSLNDTNLRLWGGFVIEHKEKTIYFGGDSGYDSHFRDVGQIFPKIDYCMIGIGAYKPEFFMGQSHTSPRDAVKGFHDTHAKVMIPMHYGTFDLADEPLGDPLRVLNELAETEISEGKIRPLKVGEMLLI